MNEDRILCEILDDGTLKVTTDPISQANHLNAENLLEGLEKALGGETIIVKRNKSKEQKQVQRKVQYQ